MQKYNHNFIPHLPELLRLVPSLQIQRQWCIIASCWHNADSFAPRVIHSHGKTVAI